MNPQPLIPVQARAMGAEKVQAVNARDLHAFLEVAKDFSDWIKVQIERARLVEHRDFEVFPFLGENPTGRPRTEYALTLDAAKHIAMLSGTDKGFQAREYFLECERRAHDPVHALLTMSRTQMLELALGLSREKEALKEQAQAQQSTIAALEPKAAFHDRVAASSGLQSIQEVAKILGAGPGNFFRWLRSERIIYGEACLPFQELLDRGYFQVREGTRINHLGRDQAFSRTYFTGKGLAWIQKRWDESSASHKPSRSAS